MTIRPMTIRIWGRRASFHVRKVIWALGELGLAFELIEAGFGIAPTPEFTARNPSALAPVLDDGEAVVWESNVIVRYLYGRHAPPVGLLDRIAAEQWMDWNATTFWPALRPLFQASERGVALDAAARTRAGREVARWLDVLEGRLAASRFLAGEAFSMADIPAGLTADRAERLGLLGDYPSVRRWLAELKARPAFPPETPGD